MNEDTDNANSQAGQTPVRESQPEQTRARSFFESFGMWIVGALAALIGSIIQVRALGASGRGEVVFLTVTVNLTMAIAMFGVQNAHANILGQEPEKARTVLTNSLVLSLLLAVVFALAAAIFFLLVPLKVMEQTGWALTIVALATVWPLVLQNHLRWLAITEYQFRLANGTMLLVPALTLVVNLVLALLGELTVAIALLAWIGGQVLATLILLVWAARAIGFGSWDPRLATRSMKFGLKSHVSSTMQLANFRLDQLFVGGIGGSAELGTYSVAVAWSETLFYMPEVLSQVQRPSLIRASRKNAAADAAFGMRVALIGTAVCAVGVIALAPILVTDIFGPEVSEAVGMLRILALGALGIAVSKVLSIALISQNHPLATAGPIGASLIVTIGLDLLLIPEYGGMGAAVASAISYIFGGLLMARIFLRRFGERPSLLVPRRSDVQALWNPVRQRLRGRRSSDGGEPPIHPTSPPGDRSGGP